MSLFNAFVATGTGSGRRSGPRALYWQTVLLLAFGSLEAGLEDLLFAAHAERQHAAGQTIAGGVNSPDNNPRKWLVEDRLQNPGSRRIEQVLFADFGVLLGPLGPESVMEIRRKSWSRGGSGRGSAVPGPTDWAQLRPYLDTMSYIRNATAHADATKLTIKNPPSCEGDLWLVREDGQWSVQQPHALTALRTVLAVYNAAAGALAASTGQNLTSVLVHPNEVNYPAAK